jgi:hypothetical protein
VVLLNDPFFSITVHDAAIRTKKPKSSVRRERFLRGECRCHCVTQPLTYGCV